MRDFDKSRGWESKSCRIQICIEWWIYDYIHPGASLKKCLMRLLHWWKHSLHVDFCWFFFLFLFFLFSFFQNDRKSDSKQTSFSRFFSIWGLCEAHQTKSNRLLLPHIFVSAFWKMHWIWQRSPSIIEARKLKRSWKPSHHLSEKKIVLENGKVYAFGVCEIFKKDESSSAPYFQIDKWSEQITNRSIIVLRLAFWKWKKLS